MDLNRLWVIIGVFAILLVSGVGYFLGIQPQLNAAAAFDSERSAVEAQNVVHRADIEALKVEYEQLGAMTAELAASRASIPAGADLEPFLGELHALEAAHGVAIVGFAATDALPFIPSSEIAATVPASVGASNFVSIPIDLSITGSHASVLAFINGLQSGDRLFLASDITSTEDDELPGIFRATISGLVYVLLDKPMTSATDAAVEVPAEGTTDAQG